SLQKFRLSPVVTVTRLQRRALVEERKTGGCPLKIRSAARRNRSCLAKYGPHLSERVVVGKVGLELVSFQASPNDYVRLWHKADSLSELASRPLLEVKQTSHCFMSTRPI